MWLVVTELEGNTDGTLENFSGMSSTTLSDLHFLSQQKVTCCSPNRVSVGASELLHMLFLSSRISTPTLFGRLLFIPQTQSKGHLFSEAFPDSSSLFPTHETGSPLLLHCLCACLFLGPDSPHCDESQAWPFRNARGRTQQYE